MELYSLDKSKNNFFLFNDELTISVKNKDLSLILVNEEENKKLIQELNECVDRGKLTTKPYQKLFKFQPHYNNPLTTLVFFNFYISFKVNTNKKTLVLIEFEVFNNRHKIKMNKLYQQDLPNNRNIMLEPIIKLIEIIESKNKTINY